MTKRFTQNPFGESFEWEIVGDDGTPTVRTFHAHRGLNFDERMTWQEHHAMLAAAGQRSRAKLNQAVKSVADDDPDAMAKLVELANNAAQEERARFPEEVDQVMALVADDTDGHLRESLVNGPLHLFQELRDWLQAVVLDRTEQDVEDVAGVPPTLPPPPSGSPDTTSGGPPSDDAGSSSTG